MTVQDVLAEYFTETEMCQLLNPEKPLTRESLQVRRSKGENHPPFIKIGKAIFYPKSEYAKWIKSQQIIHEVRKPKLRAVK